MINPIFLEEFVKEMQHNNTSNKHNACNENIVRCPMHQESYHKTNNSMPVAFVAPY